MFINTKEIPDNIKDLFQRKTFEDTSYLDITLSDFESDLNDIFNKKKLNFKKAMGIISLILVKDVDSRLTAE